MTPDDLPLMHEWLQRPHVRQWWSRRETLTEVVEHYLPCIEGTEPTDLYFSLLGDRPIGFIKTYLYADYPEDARIAGVDGDAAGVDLFIADAELVGRGLGSDLLRLFVCDVVFARAATTHCVAGPEVDNVASIRAFEKAGFRVVNEFVDPREGTTHALLRRDR